MKNPFYIKPKAIKQKDILKGISIEQKKNRKQRIVILCIILLIGITFFSGISVGKAVYNTDIKNNTEIAKPILEVEKDSEIIITEDNKIGEYYFTVKNYNNTEEVSEVDLRYYIEILENNLDDAVQYRLFKDDEEVTLEDNKTQEMTLQKDIKEEQKYTLKVEYYANKNTVGDIIEDIQIKVHSEQLKI